MVGFCNVVWQRFCFFLFLLFQVSAFAQSEVALKASAATARGLHFVRVQFDAEPQLKPDAIESAVETAQAAAAAQAEVEVALGSKPASHESVRNRMPVLKRLLKVLDVQDPHLREQVKSTAASFAATQGFEFNSSVLTPAYYASVWALHYARVMLIATDHEWEQLKIAVEELEQALEPPTVVEGFWRRKLEILKNCRSGLDLMRTFETTGKVVNSLKRSFENVARVVRLSKYFEDPWFRELILTSACVFAATHGTEFVTGVTYGTYYASLALLHLFAGDLAGATAYSISALFWYGMALPGLYDFLCHVGQGSLFIRPVRGVLNQARKMSVYLGSDLAHRVGLPKVWATIMEKQSARDRLVEAFSSSKLSAVVDFEFTCGELTGEHTGEFTGELTGDELLEVVHRDAAGSDILRLRFARSENQTLELVAIKVDREKFTATNFSQLKAFFAPYGWNVTGVIRQIHHLLSHDKEPLIAYEKTFVEKMETESDGHLRIDIRSHAVWVGSKNKLKTGYQWLNPLNVLRVNVLRDCGSDLASAGQALMQR